jgi:hypothetical protein
MGLKIAIFYLFVDGTEVLEAKKLILFNFFKIFFNWTYTRVYLYASI